MKIFTMLAFSDLIIDTAFCQNPYIKEWYKFDDHIVTRISNNEVKVNFKNYISFGERVFPYCIIIKSTIFRPPPLIYYSIHH